MNEHSIIACVPTDVEESTGIPYKPQKGYTITQCEMCEYDVHIGPKQVAAKKATPSIQVICIECIAKYYRRDMPIKTLNDE